MGGGPRLTPNVIFADDLTICPDLGSWNVTFPFLIELSSSIEPGEYEFTLNLTSNEDDYVQYQTEFNFTLLVEEGSQVMAGDVNMDSEVNILDVVITANAALGQIELTPEQFQAADVNGDDTINILDIVQIVNIILG